MKLRITFSPAEKFAWEDSTDAIGLKGQVESRRSSLAQSRAQIMYRLDKGMYLPDRRSRANDSLAELERRIAELDSSIYDIALLGADRDHRYRFVMSFENTSYVTKGPKDIINIQAPQTAAGDILSAFRLHEIRHVAESLRSKAGLEFNGIFLVAANHDKVRSEISAHRAQYAFCRESLEGVASICEIDIRYLAHEMDKNGNPVYTEITDWWNSLPREAQEQYPKIHCL